MSTSLSRSSIASMPGAVSLSRRTSITSMISLNSIDSSDFFPLNPVYGTRSMSELPRDDSDTMSLCSFASESEFSMDDYEDDGVYIKLLWHSFLFIYGQLSRNDHDEYQ